MHLPAWGNHGQCPVLSARWVNGIGGGGGCDIKAERKQGRMGGRQARGQRQFKGRNEEAKTGHGGLAGCSL
eukprot:201484-Chlamydomonas_euryale.AAC.5